jgi:hypothetical protein
LVGQPQQSPTANSEIFTSPPVVGWQEAEVNVVNQKSPADHNFAPFNRSARSTTGRSLSPRRFGARGAQARTELVPLAVDFDNDSAFMNDVVVPWCRKQQLDVTRSRAYKKNDQAFIEQKNGAVVRRLVGYGRFDGVEAAKTMARLYAAARLYVEAAQRGESHQALS